MLVGSGQLIKQGGLSAVLIAHQCKGQLRSLRQRIAAALRMEFTLLAQSGMIRRFFTLLRPVLFRRGGKQRNTDLPCIRQAQRQLVAVNPQLHRIPQRRQLHYGNLGTGQHTHVQKMLPKFPFPAYAVNSCRLTGFQFIQCHGYVPPSGLSANRFRFRTELLNYKYFFRRNQDLPNR